ncbi:hypothetical protein HUJ05_001495 [Dendroctonus ponderosae]|nr:hypothetical protein HUJ05_001495 [Dendroctonus ponderosae]
MFQGKPNAIKKLSANNRPSSMHFHDVFQGTRETNIKLSTNKRTSRHFALQTDFEGAAMPKAVVSVINSHAMTMISNVKDNPLLRVSAKDVEFSKMPIDSSGSQFVPRQCDDTKSLISRDLAEEMKEEQLGRVFLTPWLLVQLKKFSTGSWLNDLGAI